LFAENEISRHDTAFLNVNAYLPRLVVIDAATIFRFGFSFGSRRSPRTPTALPAVSPCSADPVKVKRTGAFSPAFNPLLPLPPGVTRCFPLALAVALMLEQIAEMADDQPAKMPDWAAVLRPTDLKPPRYINAPEYIPQVLKAFGPLSPLDFQRAVLGIDEIIIGYKSAPKRKPPMKFDEAEKLLAPIETHFAKSLSAWERGAPLHQALFRALIKSTPPEERKAREFEWEKIDPAPTLKNALSAVRALRDPKGYRAATGQTASQKRPERELLWEPLFGLLDHFGFRAPNFNKHQPLMRTVKALHLAVGIDPPDENLFKQAIKAWREKEAGEKG
jgi:hypothetical protein